MKTISYIVCDNGLGHIRRSYLIASKLSSKFKVNLFCNKKKFKKIFDISNKQAKVCNIDLGFDLNFQNLKKNELKTELTNAIESVKTDFIISDNLIFPIELKYKSILIANFLWEEVEEKNFSRSLYEKVNDRLVLGSKIFSTPAVKSFSRYTPTAMIGNESLCPVQDDDCVLISGGSTDALNLQLKELISKLNSLEFDNISKFYVDEQLYNSQLTNKFEIADYSDEMFNNIFLGVIRPGLGIVSELLQRGKTIFSLDLENNFEILNNNIALERNKLGRVFKSIDGNLLNALKSIDRKSNSKYSVVRFDGVDQIFLKVCEEFN